MSVFTWQYTFMQVYFYLATYSHVHLFLLGNIHLHIPTFVWFLVSLPDASYLCQVFSSERKL